MNGIDLNLPMGPSSTPRRRRRADVHSGASVKALVAATAVALLCLPGARSAQAQVIGELDVRSRLGERFFGAVPVQTGGALLDPRCIRVSPNPSAPAGAEALDGVRIRIGNSGPVDSVLIETAGNVTSPIVGIRLEVGCENPVTRDFLVLGDGVPLPGTASAVAAAAGQAETPAPVALAPAATPVAPRAAAPKPRAAPRAQRPITAAAPSLDAPRPLAETARATARPPETAVPAAPARIPLADAGGTPSATEQDNARRLTELRARSDEQAASLVALEDRLAMLQKQAEMLKAQLEQMLAQAPAQPGATAPAPAASAATPTTPASGTSTPAPVVVASANGTPIASAPKVTDATSPLATSTPSAPRKSPGIVDWLTDWRVAAGGLAALLLGVVAFKMRRRPTKATQPAPSAFNPSATAAWPKNLQPQAAPAPSKPEPYEHEKTQEFRAPPAVTRAEETVEWRSTPLSGAADRTAEWVAPPTTDTLPVPEARPAQQTAKPKTPGVGISREFHITQQFQPVAERIVALSSPEEIVLQARTHYMDDGDIFRAIDLLEMAVSARKDSPRPWQALFAIYRRENMPERYQRLVLAYRGAFGQDESWPAIRALGHQIDPNNPLYASDEPATTIPEDLIERWLGVPLDFTAHLLANEMHDQLMDTFPGRSKKRTRTAGE